MSILDACRDAAARMGDVIVRTPLVPLRSFDGATDDLLLKLETFQPIGSFKLRGVYHAVSSLTDEERQRGILTVSAGNTAQALAWCGQRFGVPARSIMPESAPRTKIDAVRNWGGEPVLVPRDEVFRFLNERLWEREPDAFIHPWTDPDLHVGHGTMGLEIVEQCPDVRSVFVPVGGGGLLAGVGQALRALKPEVRIVAVEPERCPSLHAAIGAGRPVTVECKTICDGVAVPFITDEMYPLLRDLVDDVSLVREEDVSATVKRLALQDKLVVEPSGVLAVAAALQASENAAGPAVALVTGGSIDATKLSRILTDAW